jgi:hypothetical protein
VTILLPSGPDQAATLPIPTEPASPAARTVAATQPASVPALSPAVSSLLVIVVERLYAEYGCCLPLSAVLDVVAGCVSDIQATPAAAIPELSERLARHRLAEIGHRPGS